MDVPPSASPRIPPVPPPPPMSLRDALESSHFNFCERSELSLQQINQDFLNPSLLLVQLLYPSSRSRSRCQESPESHATVTVPSLGDKSGICHTLLNIAPHGVMRDGVPCTSPPKPTDWDSPACQGWSRAGRHPQNLPTHHLLLLINFGSNVGDTDTSCSRDGVTPQPLAAENFEVMLQIPPGRGVRLPRVPHSISWL